MIDNDVCVNFMVNNDGERRQSMGVIRLPPTTPFGKWRNSSLRGKTQRRPASLRYSEHLTISCTQLEDVQKDESGAASNWASGLDKLLEDEKGRETFTEFLKKEFSAENIHFWVSCENYQKIESAAERVEEAKHIYNTHLCKGASEPVNVDSQARNITQDALAQADPQLFLQAQKQIFNLMKFDSYPRFLKSDLYKKCLVNEENRQNKSESDVHNTTKTNKLKKSLSNAEDRRRKSLLPWHRKNRSKSKDRGEMEYCQKDKEEVEEPKPDNKDVYNSRTSLVSWDVNDDTRSIGENSSISGTKNIFCRVILSDGATTVVQIRPSETIREMINRLLEKRGFTYTNYEVFFTNKSKPLDLNKDSFDLAGCEVVIEHRIVFKLDLPNRKIISVKSKPTKILTDVLRPILHKYGYKLELVRVLESAKNEYPMNIHVPVTAVDGFRICIQMLSSDMGSTIQDIPKTNTHTQSLDEITNKVFEELLQGKSENNRASHMSDQGSLKSEDWGSEHSSGIFGRLLRRDSTTNEKRMKKSSRNKGTSSLGSVEDVRSEFHTKKPLIAKWKPGIKLHVTHKTSESDELYEGLKRAQRSRLEDQRGTEINFELPDFLKDKENSEKDKKLRNKHRLLPESVVNELSSKFYGHINNHDRFYKNKNEDTKSSRSSLNSPSSPYYTTSASDESPTKSGLLETTIIENITVKNFERMSSPTYHNSPIKLITPIESEPPPLPPKPKVLPIKPSNWKKMTPTVKDAKGKGTLYLDQPTSSFV